MATMQLQEDSYMFDEDVPSRIRRWFDNLPSVLRDQIWGGIQGVIAIAGLIVALLAVLIAISQSAPSNSRPRANDSSQGAAATATAMATATQGQTVDTPTTLAITPTPTILAPTPTVLALANAVSLPENVRLKCESCSDPILVTITKIVIQPDQNRMLWTLSFYNNSQQKLAPDLPVFSLQEGEDTTHTFSSTGPTTSQGATFYLSQGESKSVTVTFSFVPYKGVTYTLSSKIGAFDGFTAVVLGIDMDPIEFTF